MKQRKAIIVVGGVDENEIDMGELDQNEVRRD